MSLKRRVAALQKKQPPVRRGIIRKTIPGLKSLVRSGSGAVAVLEVGVDEETAQAAIREIKKLLPDLQAVIIVPDNGREPVEAA